MKKLCTIILSTLFAISLNAEVYINGISYNLNSENKTAEVKWCYSEGDVIIPESIEYDNVTYSVTSIGYLAFLCSTDLTSVTIPLSVTSIGDLAFLYCTGLTSITIPSSVTSIGERSFDGCTGLTSITIPEEVTSIGYCAFTGCTGLESIIVAEGNPVYDSRNDCNAIIETANNTLILGCKNTLIPSSVTSIGMYSFKGCTGLTSIIIPSSVTSIGMYSFQGCTNLTCITIPEGVTSILFMTFEGCTNLTSIIIPSSVTFIENDVFTGCTGLTSVTAYRPLKFDWMIFDEEISKSATLYVPKGWKDIFQESSDWGKFSAIVEKDLPDTDVNRSPFSYLYSKRLVLSYTNRDDDGGSSFTDKTNANEIFKQAIMFPADRMERLKGNQITYIRFRMWHTNVTNMKVWIGTDKDERDLVCQDVTDLHEGWNEVALEHPYTITGEQIFVGVDCAGDYTDYFTLPIQWDAYAGSDTECYEFRMNNKWEKSNGTWYIQCMVEGETVPKNDVQLLELAGPLYKRTIKPGEPYECTLKLRNWGSMGIEQWQAMLDGKEVECSPQSVIGRGGGGIQEIGFVVTPDKDAKVGNNKLTIKPKTLNGEAYDNPEAPKELTVKVYEHDMGRQKVLVQVYSGTWCGSCPEFDELVEQKMKERDDLVLVSIHCGWGKYHTKENDILGSMNYRNGVPDVDLNRCVWQTERNYRDITMYYHLDDAKAQPSFASVNIAGLYHEESRTVNITVSGERNEDFAPVEEWTNLTVLLVEDNVVGPQDDSRLEDDNYTNLNYIHNGVNRTNVSAIWGDLVEWNGDKYEMHYSVKLDDGWNKDNMRVVAFLGKPFTGNNYDEINVVNCDEMYLKDVSAGIQEINMEHTVTDAYDLNGRKIRSNALSLEGLHKGIYIIKGKKVVVK